MVPYGDRHKKASGGRVGGDRNLGLSMRSGFFPRGRSLSGTVNRHLCKAAHLWSECPRELGLFCVGLLPAGTNPAPQSLTAIDDRRAFEVSHDPGPCYSCERREHLWRWCPRLLELFSDVATSRTSIAGIVCFADSGPRRSKALY